MGELQSDLLQARRDEESILVTNLLDAPTHPPEAIVREYKKQASVEVRFRSLKDPAFVDGSFVKDKGRLEALASHTGRPTRVRVDRRWRREA